MAPTYTTTAHGLRWLPGGNLISDIDAGFQTLAEDVDTKLLGTGTSLPGSPVDGQQFYYVADATNGVVWHLRYRSASASAYKWECVGGAYLINEVTTDETHATASLSYIDLATVGPSITAPLAGDYECEIGFTLHPLGTLIRGKATAKIGAAAASDNQSAVAYGTNSSDLLTVSRFMPITAAASDVIKMMYAKDQTGVSVGFVRRAIRLRPRRVG